MAGFEEVFRHGGVVWFVCVERCLVIAKASRKFASGLANVETWAFATGQFVDFKSFCRWYLVVEGRELTYGGV